MTRTSKLSSLTHDIVSLYLSGKSTYEIASTFGVNPASINRALRKQNIILRNAKGQRIRKHKYDVDHFAFSGPLNEYKEYWIGFLLADGAITNNGDMGQQRVGLELQTLDRNHLEKFKQFLNSSYRILDYSRISKFPNVGKGYECQSSTSVLYCHSDILAKSLADYGVTQRKSYTATPHNSLVNSRHFWRGVVDGDGFISIGSEFPQVYFPDIHGKTKVATGITGSYNTCVAFKQFVHSISTSEANVLKEESKNAYKFNLSWGPASQVITFLYKDANIYLDRKYYLAMDIINKQPKGTYEKSINTDSNEGTM